MGYFEDEKRRMLVTNRLEMRSSYKKLKKQIKKILDKYYEDVYDYFLRLLSSDYDYIVLVSRRCLVLMQIFIIVFITDRREEVKNCKSKIISDKVLPMFDFHEKNVIIADDVIVHGSAVRELYHLLKTVYYAGNVEIHSYMADRKIDIDDIDKKLLKVQNYVFTNEWRIFSNKVVDCISQSGVPYTSFVTSIFKYGTGDFFQKITDDNNINIIPLSEKHEDEKNYSSYVCFEKKRKLPKVIEKISWGECIRVYVNKEIEKITIIPYIFLKEMSIDELSRFCHEVAECLASYQKIKSELMFCKKDDRGGYELKARLLTCIISVLYWSYFAKEYGLKEEIEYSSMGNIDFDTLDKSFGRDISDEIIGLFTEDISLLGNCSIDISSNLQEEGDMTNIWNQCKKRAHKDYKCAVEDFFHEVWFLDEENIKQKKDRCDGLGLDVFLEKEKNKQLMQAALIYSWDKGTSTADFRKCETTKRMTCKVSHGEQSYRRMLEKYPFVLYALVLASQVCTEKIAKENGMQLGEYRVKKLCELLEQLKAESRHMEERDVTDISNLVKMDNGIMSAWNLWQPDVLSYAEGEQEQVLKSFINKIWIE